MQSEYSSQVSGIGAFARGTNVTVNADGAMALGYGQVSGSRFEQLHSSGRGSLAMGYSRLSGDYVRADGDGAWTIGQFAANASGAGSFAHGDYDIFAT